MQLVRLRSPDPLCQICELLRGESVKPLYITAKGMSLDEAKKVVASMHGKYRFPTLLKEVDSVARKLFKKE